MEQIRDLMTYLDASPSAAHAGEETARRLTAAGYTRLYEGDAWHLTPGGKYFVQRDFSAIIAFRYRTEARSFMITASHSDSPTFRLSPAPWEVAAAGKYTRLSVEKYGGMLSATWMDRPLSLAGVIAVRTPEGIRMQTVCVDRDLLIIPSVAIHMNRSANENASYNPAVDMQPLFAGEVTEGALLPILAEAAGVNPADVAGAELGLYNRQRATVLGAKGEFIAAARLDDLGCAYAALQAFLTAGDGAAMPVYVLFDHEEIGSATPDGAASTYLADTLSRIAGCLGVGEEGLSRMLSDSFLVSADNAHAQHPNHPEYADPVHAPRVGGGVVVKYNANRRYISDAASIAVFEEICRRAEVPVQHYCNRADIPGGSTLGCISNGQVSVSAVDIGLAQLAMHSAYETAGVADVDAAVRALRRFYESALSRHGEEIRLL